MFTRICRYLFFLTLFKQKKKTNILRLRIGNLTIFITTILRIRDGQCVDRDLLVDTDGILVVREYPRSRSRFAIAISSSNE